MSIALPALALTGRGASGTAAVALTMATGLLFWSGENYRRAWAHGIPLSAAPDRRGDLVSGIGRVVLGAAMMGVP